jgi:hypothetical protein
MDYIYEFDSKLATIKAYHTFLTEIIDKGYLNDISTVDNIIYYINMFYKSTSLNEPDMSEIDSLILTDNNYSANYSENHSTNHSVNHKDTTTEEESDNYDQPTVFNDEEKIRLFMDNSNDLSSILLYNKKSKYINRMRKFVNSCYEY